MRVENVRRGGLDRHPRLGVEVARKPRALDAHRAILGALPVAVGRGDDRLHVLSDAATGERGMAAAIELADAVARACDIATVAVQENSTGVIGVEREEDLILSKLEGMVESLNENSLPDVARAILLPCLAALKRSASPCKPDLHRR